MRITNQSDLDLERVEFFDFIVCSLDEVWNDILMRERKRPIYQPRVVLFTSDVNTECGQGLTQFGPFYCSADWSVYLDARWFDKLRGEYGAKEGSFSEVYVLAHEFGHHIQNLLGEFHRILTATGASSTRVRGELVADAYAGIWVHYVLKDKDFPWTITEEDIDIALAAATAVGDDTIQLREKGQIEPEKFGHGTAEQRKKAFLLGLETGSIVAADRLWEIDLDSL